MCRFPVVFHLYHLNLSVSQVVPYNHQEVDLKVSPKGEGFNPMIQTIKSLKGGAFMDFGEAIKAMKSGHKVAREGWNGKGMFIVYMPPLYLPPYNTADTARKVNDRTAKWIGTDTPLDSQGYIAMFTAQKKWQPGWLASQADILSDDWEIVD